MKLGFSLTKKQFALFVVILVAMLVGACYKSNEASTPKTKEGEIDPTRPPKIAKAYFYDGGVCPIDSSIPKVVSDLIAVSKKLPLSITGWATTDSTGKPVAPMIFAVLSNGTGTFYLEGKRTPRPDVANGNRLLDLVGFEIAGSLANIPVGDYKLGIASGTEFVVDNCKTPVVVRVGE
ncbi:hypothetical protein [Sideroxydans sp. CL21]|uniref:hypothetical protein n=1 Tax=Sideroxydans sp. CL21 TaxID=2600596 RepID=UPI0024BC20CE|nr:hypothetical protein [Sideroxydans sp. CL21]